MITILTTFLQGAWSKAVPWLIGAGAITIILWRIASTLVTTGAQQERLRTIETNLKEQANEAHAKAAIDAMSASAARQRLRDKWRAK